MFCSRVDVFSSVAMLERSREECLTGTVGPFFEEVVLEKVEEVGGRGGKALTRCGKDFKWGDISFWLLIVSLLGD